MPDLDEKQKQAELKSARGHVEKCRVMIERYTHRRDHGDQVPDVDFLTRMIENETAQLRTWEARVKALEMPPDPPLA